MKNITNRCNNFSFDKSIVYELVKFRISCISGTYAAIVLNGGQESTLHFTRAVEFPKQMCFKIEYRKGPQVAGDRSYNQLSAVFHSTVSNGYYYLNVTSDAKDWTTVDLPISWWGGPGLVSPDSSSKTTSGLTFSMKHTVSDFLTGW